MMSHQERRERREAIADYVGNGNKTIEEARAYFNVSEATIKIACEEFDSTLSHAERRERRKSMADYTAAGHTLDETAACLDVTRVTVRAACKEFNVLPIDAHQLVPFGKTFQHVMRLAMLGLSQGEMAAEAGVSRARVGQIMAKLGLTQDDNPFRRDRLIAQDAARAEARAEAKKEGKTARTERTLQHQLAIATKLIQWRRQGLTPGEMADRLNMSINTVTCYLGDLTAKGLVPRMQNSGCRRTATSRKSREHLHLVNAMTMKQFNDQPS